jgi:hypothetical protein
VSLARGAGIPIAPEHPIQNSPRAVQSRGLKENRVLRESQPMPGADYAIPAHPTPSLIRLNRIREMFSHCPMNREELRFSGRLSTPWVRPVTARPLPHGFTSTPTELLECCPIPRLTIHRTQFGHLRWPSKMNSAICALDRGVAWSSGILVITSSRPPHGLDEFWTVARHDTVSVCAPAGLPVCR